MTQPRFLRSCSVKHEPVPSTSLTLLDGYCPTLVRRDARGASSWRAPLSCWGAFVWRTGRAGPYVGFAARRRGRHGPCAIGGRHPNTKGLLLMMHSDPDSLVAMAQLVHTLALQIHPLHSANAELARGIRQAGTAVARPGIVTRPARCHRTRALAAGHVAETGISRTRSRRAGARGRRTGLLLGRVADNQAISPGDAPRTGAVLLAKTGYRT
jgi:hypothetical protein